MSTIINDTSVVAATLVAQVSIIVVMFAISVLIAWGNRGVGGGAYIVLALALVTLITLMFTRGYSATWGPLLGTNAPVGLARSTSMLVVFLVNIAAVHALVVMTGGSRESPFSAIYFLIPTLALFLRESLDHVVLFLSLVAASYTYLSLGNRYYGSYDSRLNVHRFAYWFSAVACFILATYIGYVTRP
jgi:hypothetical protein